jgi:hypothetical protein
VRGDGALVVYFEVLSLGCSVWKCFFQGRKRITQDGTRFLLPITVVSGVKVHGKAHEGHA